MTNKTCQHCKQINNRKYSKWCSNTCRKKSKYKRKTPLPSHICLNCRNKSKKASNYCSDLCYRQYRHKQKYIPKTSPICLNCNKESLKLSNFCSSSCYNKYNYKPIHIKNTCKFCKKIFISPILKNCCSKKCAIAYRYKKRIEQKLCYCGKNLEDNFSTCQECRMQNRKYKRNNNRPLEKQILNSARARAKKNKLPINITIEDIIIPTFCPVLGLKLEKGKGKSQPNSPSLDRIIPSLGYVKGNIMIISHKANTIKQNANIDEIKNVLEYMVKHHKH